MRGPLYAPATLALGKNRGTHRIGDWVISRASLDDEEQTSISSLAGFKHHAI